VKDNIIRGVVSVILVLSLLLPMLMGSPNIVQAATAQPPKVEVYEVAVQL